MPAAVPVKPGSGFLGSGFRVQGSGFRVRSFVWRQTCAQSGVAQERGDAAVERVHLCVRASEPCYHTVEAKKPYCVRVCMCACAGGRVCAHMRVGASRDRGVWGEGTGDLSRR